MTDQPSKVVPVPLNLVQDLARMWKAYHATPGSQSDAYYALAKGHWDTWDKIAAIAAAPHEEAQTPAPQGGGEALILKGVGKINGDGWKDTTQVGEVVFVWNDELPSPFGSGQYRRIGQEHWTASTAQYDFAPATVSEVRAYFDLLLAALKPQTPDVLGECDDCGSPLNSDGECVRDLAEREQDDACEAIATPPGDVLGGEGERDEALEWFLKVVASGGSQGVPAGDTWSVVNAFCDDRGDGDDTYNVSENRKLTETWHSGFGDGCATVKITGAGKAYLQALAARPSQSDEGETS